MPHKALISDWDRLDKALKKNELFVALFSMQNGKFLGINGLSCEFYKELWGTVGDEFCSLAHEVFSISNLSKSLKQGLIKLILKNTTRDSVSGCVQLIC